VFALLPVFHTAAPRPGAADVSVGAGQTVTLAAGDYGHVTVAATGVDCDRKDDRLDMGEATERSRELLEKRRLVVDSGEAVASAQGVFDDVELALRQVAELPACVKRHDVELVQKDVEARQLLMRIRLMQRELEG